MRVEIRKFSIFGFLFVLFFDFARMEGRYVKVVEFKINLQFYKINDYFFSKFSSLLSSSPITYSAHSHMALCELGKFLYSKAKPGLTYAIGYEARDESEIFLKEVLF